MSEKNYTTKQFYECNFCKDLWEEETEANEHAESCLYNPAVEAAPTCKHFRQYHIVEGLGYYHDIVTGKAIMPDEFRTFYHTPGNPEWEIADLSQPILSLTEEEAEEIRKSQTHDVNTLKVLKVEKTH